MNPFFRYKACTFGITRDKKETARAAFFDITKSINIVTIEISTFGFVSKETKEC
jgi:hypothetical protein